MPPKLESPGAGRKESYLSLVAEFRERQEPFVPFTLGFSAEDFPAFLRKLEACARGEEIPAGFVAHEMFWLVAEDGEVVAVSSLRLALTDALRKNGGHIGFGVRPSARRRGYATAILRETLVQAGARGIPRVLVTCDRGNLGSAGAIRKNGGVLESEERLEGRADILQRYWIELPAAGSGRVTPIPHKT